MSNEFSNISFLLILIACVFAVGILAASYLMVRRAIRSMRDGYESRIQVLEERLRQQSADLQQSSALRFENIAGKTLSEQTERLNRQNQRDLNLILSPLKENLSDFRKAVNDSYMKENSSREALSRQIDSLIAANSAISSEARKLSNALRGNIRMQGEWGETILNRLLETAGFIRGVHYLIQPMEIDGKRLEDDEKKRQRPDMVFLLPDNVRLVVDSKTSMTAYLKYCDAANEDEEENSLRSHVASVRRHIDTLARAQYHKYIPGAIEHTLMFMPNDGAYMAAIRHDHDLTEYALRNNIVIVSPAHLLSVISMIGRLWRIENQNKNAEEIARLGGLIYDKIATFFNDFESLEKYISNLESAYDKTLRHLKSGPTSIAARAAKLRDLGAKTTKIING